MAASAGTTVRIRKKTYQKCEDLLNNGEFPSFSEIVNYSMRLYLYHIHSEGINSVTHLVGEDVEFHRVRLNPWVRQKMIDTNLFNSGDLAEYSLTFFLDERSRMNIPETESLETEE